MEFRQGLDARNKRYVVGINSDTLVFLEAPLFEEPDSQEKKPGRPRKYPKLAETNPLPVKVAELGLDHHEGRSWPGWHRHVLLVFLASGYLTLQRIQEKKRLQQAWWHQRMKTTTSSPSQ